MNVRPDEISSVLISQIEKYDIGIEEIDAGFVIQVGDNIARVYGLNSVKSGELLEFPGGVMGIAFNLEEDNVGVVILGDDRDIHEGDLVKRTTKIVHVPVGEGLIGRVVNALGQPIDGKGPLKTSRTRSIEGIAPKVIERQPVKQPLQTGIKSIDALIPIGRGQRELIIGDRQTGKTALAVDTILNQKEEDVICIYVAIGQKTSTIAQVVNVLEHFGAMRYSIVVCASANEPASMLYIAPYAGCAMGEELMYSGKDVLIVYDDLTKHAKAYREIALLLRRPPGREAYPGDIFFLHSRLLERGAKLSDELGGGSMTSLPIIETQVGDVTAYIPTNLISITDGQIYLDTDLFYQGIRPAVDVGLSVSRVGGNAQVKAMKQVAGPMRLDLSQYRDLAAFARFGSELDKATKDQLDRGARITEILKQEQFKPLPLEKQVAILYAAVNGFIDDIKVPQITRFIREFLDYLNVNSLPFFDSIKTKKQLDKENIEMLEQAITKFKDSFSEGAISHKIEQKSTDHSDPDKTPSLNLGKKKKKV